jgi:DNA-binding LytR/AlgR family response regulator
VHRLRELIGRLETRLDPARFLRVHRCAIVNGDRIIRIEAGPSAGRGSVPADGTCLSLSRPSRLKIYDVAT